MRISVIMFCVGLVLSVLGFFLVAFGSPSEFGLLPETLIKMRYFLLTVGISLQSFAFLLLYNSAELLEEEGREARIIMR